MKKVLTSILMGFIISTTISASADEFGYFTRSDASLPWQGSVSLHSGDRLVFLSADSQSWHIQLSMPGGYTVSLSAADDLGFSNTSGASAGSEESRTIVGPCTVEVLTGGSRYISYKVIHASDNSITPANVISLPADVNSDMQLVFESSDDLLQWSQVYSFSHSSTNGSSKFFRTRLIQGTGE